MDRRSLLVGFLAGGWLATVLVFVAPSLGLRPATAEEPNASTPRQPFGPNGPQLPGPTVNPLGGAPDPKGFPSPGGGTSDANRTSIALAASIGNGESAVYFFDTEAKRLLVYQYRGVVGHNRPLGAGDSGGIRLLAARQYDYDLRLTSYRDLSEQTRNQLRDTFTSAFGSSDEQPAAGPLPTKTVDVPGGFR